MQAQGQQAETQSSAIMTDAISTQLMAILREVRQMSDTQALQQVEQKRLANDMNRINEMQEEIKQ